MNSDKENLLLHLADHTGTMDLALEGANPNDKMIYLGHLAMCARLFRSLHLGETSEVLQIARVEDSAFRLGTPSDERGMIAKESWAAVRALLDSYLGRSDT